ncbi:MAG TPA: DUF2937 family protein [Beijerinckiaceae bacterium]|jgi:hypothetical protein
MPRVARTVAFAFGLLGGVAASQGPEFAQQYRQRLGGAVDELRRVVTRFDADAQATGQDRAGAIERLRQNPDRLTSLQGDAMRGNVERLSRLEGQRVAFADAGPFARLALLVREGDVDLARAAWRDFEPAVPTTQEGFVTAVLGFFFAYALSRLIGVPMRRVAVRRPRVRAA